MLKNMLRCIAFATLLVSLPSAADKIISADDSGYLYTGRIDFSDAKRPNITWPGTSIKAQLKSRQLKIILDDKKGQNYFNVIINGDDAFPYVIELKQGKHAYDVSHMLTEDSNQIEIFKRTEGFEGPTRFIGFEVDDDAKLLDTPKRFERRIAFFGDSITSGMGNEAADNGKDNIPAEKNHYLSYAAITARNLNAEFHTISRSGIGFMVSWFDFIMPEYYDQLDGIDNNESKWDFAAWQPEVVVVNLGQNDSWLIDNEKRLQPEPTVKDITAAYKAFIQTLRGHYPKSQFVLAMGSMDITKTERWPSYVKEAVKQIKAEDKKAKIETVFFEFTGYEAHPRVHQHIKNADKLTAYLRELMNW